MSYELRVGILAAVIIGLTIWGYKFMKGKNILLPSNTYYVTYTNVDELTARDTASTLNISLLHHFFLSSHF